MNFYINKYQFFAPSLQTIYDWKEWVRGLKTIDNDDTQVPDINFVPPMLRRKLSQSIKMTLFVAYQVAKDCGDIASVYSSQFGEWEKTVKQLQSYFDEKTVSPATFGLSVHNAAIGMFSLIQGNNKSYTSVSGNKNSFDVGFIEAVTTLNKEDKVLYVSSDERIPDLYKPTFPDDNKPLAMGLVMGKKRLSIEDIALSIEFDNQPVANLTNHKHSLDFIKFVLSDDKSFKGNNFTLARRYE